MTTFCFGVYISPWGMGWEEGEGLDACFTVVSQPYISLYGVFTAVFRPASAISGLMRTRLFSFYISAQEKIFASFPESSYVSANICTNFTKKRQKKFF
jgi:hypothetical protein